MVRPLLVLLAVLPAAPALAGEGIPPPPGPQGIAVIDCAGDFAAAGLSNHAVDWTLTVRAYMPHVPLGSAEGWHTWTYAHHGSIWARHGALRGVLALYHDIALAADGGLVARSSCGLEPFEPGT